MSAGLAALGCGAAGLPAHHATVTVRETAAATIALAPAPAPAPAQAPAARRSVTPRRRSHALAATNPLTGKTVVIDPGHNGDNYLHPGIINGLVPAGRGRTKACDTTGTSTNAGYSEASFNFDVALRLQRLLLAQGARVLLTRHTNTGVGPCVNVRAAIGNRAHADAVISIHADGAPAGDRGFSVLYAPDVGDTAPIYAASLRLARALDHTLGASGVLPISNYVGPGGYSVRTDLAGLNLSTRPKIFVELGNMRNSADAGIQTSARGRERLAQALDAGLEKYL
ncbi:MAG TPA: N-acetylmuramoyl-L-alanine amidase [Solirubrobacteraceae bacterium]|nr:N-acetylmuramoyl-L-alanine amidase [Solirubrobacteraceae bacterium]